MTFLASRKLDKIWTFFAPLFVIFLGADQVSKEWAMTHLEEGTSRDVGLVLTYNYGVVFGFDLPLPLIYVLTAAILGLGTYLVIKNRLWQDHWHLGALSLLLAGAIGNVVDRLRFGAVVDFIKVYWWPTFNLADLWIVLGVLLFAWEFLFREDGVEKL